MTYTDLGEFSLIDTGKVNIILGKNGCGKSYLLKKVEQHLPSKPNMGKVRYISPERAGFLTYEPGIDQAISNQSNWLSDSRRKNQSANFKQQSVALYRRLEHLTLREIERDHVLPGYTPKNFQTTIDKINSLLDRVEIERQDESGFKIIEKDTKQPAQAEDISSGESELVSLAIEFLSFIKECIPDKENFLLVDEPDVHLHPDLQDRLAVFISSIIADSNVNIIFATHSTPLLAALAREMPSKVAFMRRGDKVLNFADVSEVHKRILPMFGAHPLSNIFNEAPILLVEGEDDERIWQQAVRSSTGGICVYPCVADSVDQLNQFEVEANNIIETVYDNAEGYSLRDRDLHPEAIEDLDNITRMRLSCRAAENLLLSDDVLALAGTNWNQLEESLKTFVQESTHHPYHRKVKEFVESGLDRKNADLKDIRMILAGFITTKPWEVIIGQTIASLKTISKDENSLTSYLGEKVCQEILELS